MPTKPVKKRNPQDVTLRNINALKNKVALLTAAVDQLELNQEYFKGEIAALKRQADQR